MATGRCVRFVPMGNGDDMSKPSPRREAESSRAYRRLIKGEISSKQYVQTLKKEARSSVTRHRGTKGRSASA